MKRIFLLFIITINFSFFAIKSSAQNPCHFTGYRCDTIPYNFTTITGDTLFGMPDDTYSPIIPIGFSFRFYDVAYTSLVVSNNCFVSFDTALADSSSAWYISVPIPSASNPLNAIFGPWQDLYNMMEGTIHYQTIGLAPNRKFVVSFDSIPFLLCATDYFTGQIVLSETANTIDIYINSKLLCANWNSGLAIEGIQNANASMATAAPGRNCPNQWTAYHDGRRFSPVFTPATAPSLCMATVDTATNYNLVIWNQPSGIVIDSFFIYREINNSGNYSLIATQAQHVFSTYEDLTSYPMQAANRYKLAYTDSCGTRSYLSASHRTMHLALSPGGGNSWQLNWNPYEGISFPYYYIYRGTSPATLALLDSVASNLITYTDTAPPVGNVYYLITINGGGCNPSARISSINYTVSMSNYASTNTIGMPVAIEEKKIFLAPNPSSGNIFVINNSFPQNFALTVTDILGNELLNIPSLLLQEGSNPLNLSALNNGIYFIRLDNGTSALRRRISIVR